jgi:hypothetical protein
MNPQKKSLTDILCAGNGGPGWIDDDWDNVAPAPEFGPLPPGKYVAHLTDKTFATASKGTPSVKLTFAVCEGDHQGRKLFFDVWLTDAAKPQARRDLAKLGIASKAQLESPLPASKRIRCELRVIIEESDKGNTYNKVRGFEAVGVDDVPADPFAPAPDTSAADAGTPPAIDPAAPRPSLFGSDGKSEANGAYRGDRR